MLILTFSFLLCVALFSLVSLLKQWQKELETRTHAGVLKVCVWYGSNRPKVPDSLVQYDVVLTTYQTMATSHSKKTLEGLSYYRIIIDESTYIKGGANTNMYNALMRLRAPRRWAVSGTPMGNKISALNSIMRFLGVAPFAQLSMFEPLVRHFDRRLASSHTRGSSEPESLPVHLTPALSFVLKNIVMRHCKRQIFKGEPLVKLPPSSGRMITVTLSKNEKLTYDAAEADALMRARSKLRSEKAANTNIIALRQLLLPVRMGTTGLIRTLDEQRQENGQIKRTFTVRAADECAKITQLLKDVRDMREKDPVCKFVIFCEHADLKKVVVQALTDASIGAKSLDGTMPAPTRGRILSNMAEDPDFIVLVLSSSFSHGLNLIWASVVVFLEPGLSQEMELQACDRVRRIGQVRPTTILTYVAKDTVDERICDVRKLRGHPAFTGEKVVESQGGNEALSHRLRFATYFNDKDAIANAQHDSGTGADPATAAVGSSVPSSVGAGPSHGGAGGDWGGINYSDSEDDDYW